MQKGESLVEITIAIGVILLVLGALTITILVGLKNSQFAQNSLQATKLAQAGMENIKLFRNRNIPICVTEGPPPIDNYYWDDRDLVNQPVLWDESGWNGEVKFFFQANEDDECGLSDSASYEQAEGLIESKFKRLVNITYVPDDDLDVYTNKIKFEVEVSWEDSGGEHKSELVTILSNY